MFYAKSQRADFGLFLPMTVQASMIFTNNFMFNVQDAVINYKFVAVFSAQGI